MTEDTICAPATPPVNSSIAIIRISGPDTRRAIDSHFSLSGDIKPRHAHYGTLHDKEGQVDDVIMIYYPAPHSYTGEEMAEIFCHGNQIIVKKIIMLLNALGVRMAEPGEFTRRAFLNGKIDLTEAEAINHIISAKSEWEIETSFRQMHGSLRKVIATIRNSITELKADIEAAIDFTDEGIEFVTPDQALRVVRGIQVSIEDLLNRCTMGEQLSHGIDITITGKPNVGKSSVLNLLLNQERAIVSNIPGTTRDIIREPFQICGMHVNLVDTAGIDTPGDEIEKMGIDLSYRKIETSPFIILVLDALTGIHDADLQILEKTKNKKRIILINKTDAAGKETIAEMQQKFAGDAVLFSALTGAGLQDLKEAMSRKIRNEYVQIENSFIADMRVIALLKQAGSTVEKIYALVESRSPGEIIAFELQSLMDVLADITGEITPDDILDSIFSRFCIGK
jgi:tRNA modification GTPase